MGIRSSMEQKPALGVAFALALVVGAIAFVFWSGRPPHEQSAQLGDLAWFTDDDGHTWFSDARSKLAPFDHNGKEAYRTYVFTCDGGKTKFAAYLERFTANGKAAIGRAKSAVNRAEPPPAGVMERVMSTEMEVKKPGDAEWIRVNDPRAIALRTPKCPDGSKEHPQPVIPGE